MSVTADTNVLVRAIVIDDPEQSRAASLELQQAEIVVVSVAALCEFVWVLRKSYKFANDDVAHAIRLLIGSENVRANRPAIDAGLAMLDAGGDFADGVIAFEGEQFGAATFLSFDRKAVTLLESQGRRARLL